jgi:hypothetical protein
MATSEVLDEQNGIIREMALQASLITCNVKSSAIQFNIVTRNVVPPDKAIDKFTIIGQ